MLNDNGNYKEKLIKTILHRIDYGEIVKFYDEIIVLDKNNNDFEKKDNYSLYDIGNNKKIYSKESGKEVFNLIKIKHNLIENETSSAYEFISYANLEQFRKLIDSIIKENVNYSYVTIKDVINYLKNNILMGCSNMYIEDNYFIMEASNEICGHKIPSYYSRLYKLEETQDQTTLFYMVLETNKIKSEMKIEEWVNMIIEEKDEYILKHGTKKKIVFEKENGIIVNYSVQ